MHVVVVDQSLYHLFRVVLVEVDDLIALLVGRVHQKLAEASRMQQQVLDDVHLVDRIRQLWVSPLLLLVEL